MDKSIQSLKFEEAFDLLQLQVKKLETGDLHLDQALSTFEQGVQLIKKCQEHLGAADRKVQMLTSQQQTKDDGNA